MSVGLVLVSHSSKIAEGLVDLAAQMAPDVSLVAAGGTDDGRIGTSLEKVMDGVAAANTGSGVLILCDLGSAVMTAESALEFLGGPEDVSLADAPLVEGSVAAAVTAQGGGSLATVKAAAEEALTTAVQRRLDSPTAGAVGGEAAAGSASEAGVGGGIVADVTLVNPMGLHARPAAVLAGYLGNLDVDVEINGVDGQSVMMLMTLGATQGSTLHVVANGPDAKAAADYIREQVEAGFGEI